MALDEEGFFDTLLSFCSGGKVALLQAYFDESERPNGLLCVAGYAFASDQARRLSKEFGAEFGKYGGLHMKELVHRVKNYKGISERERDRLLKSAVAIVNRRFSYGVAVTVNVKEYLPQAPRFIVGLKEAYPYCCHLAIAAMASLLREHGDLSQITYVFEAGHPHQAEAMRAIQQIAAVPDVAASLHYSGHAFLPKADAVPLQAADLLAWESAKFKDETLDGIRQPRLSMLNLFAGHAKRYKVCHCQGPTLAKALVKMRKLGLEQVQEDLYEKRLRKVQRGDKSDSQG